MGENIWMRAKTKANLKPELKAKFVWNTCCIELGGEIKSAYENYLLQKLTWKLAKVTFCLRNLCKIFRVK